MFKISEYISLDNIVILNTNSKEEALNILLDRLVKSEKVISPEQVREEILEREKLMSTGIGLGIGVPHVRSKAVKDLIIVVGVCSNGIEYNSIDDKPVNIIFMIASPEKTHKLYLQVLAKVTLMLKNQEIRSQLINAKTPEEVYRVLKDH